MSKVIVGSTIEKEYYSSKEIAIKSGLTRTEVFAALKNLAEAGVIKTEHIRKEHGRYYDFLYALKNI